MSESPGTLIVTGGSRGIGAAIARLAATRGYAVAINYLFGADSANKLVQEISQSGGCAAAIQADMGNEPDILQLFKYAEKTLGPLTARVNNAAVTGGLRALIPCSPTCSRACSPSTSPARSSAVAKRFVAALEHINGELTDVGYWKKTASERAAAEKANPQIASRVAATNSLREELYSRLESLGEHNIQDLKHEYGAIADVE
jgi:NAD(P)-dependent dehydrogenase (short-subunit alcohol dehydrogenase family)